jgi:inosose dehydratase
VGCNHQTSTKWFVRESCARRRCTGSATADRERCTSGQQRGVEGQGPGLNQAGRVARAAGLEFAYHNHWWEFQSKIGEIEALYTQTDPSLVCFLLDAGHAYHGGADVPDFLRRHANRIGALHFRDYRNGHLVPLGQGTFPLSEVAATLKQLQWSGWAINEEEREDSTKGGRSFIEPAYQAMRGAFST